MIITKENFNKNAVGTKAANLFKMQENGINVPVFFCTDISSAEEAAVYAKENFYNTELFSVRSSSSAEDGEIFSFAGQFRTFLNVKRGEIPECIRKISDFETSEGYLKYCRENGIDPENIGMTVIVQQMINADISGVIFTANPQGILNETVIAAGNGTGDNVVEDKTDATVYYFNRTDKQYYFERHGNSPLIDENTLKKLIEISEKIKEIFGVESDIEFAVKDGEIFILQARPITTLPKNSEPIILDNSNIVESYPGITLPLTQSFVRDAYYAVFRSVLLRLTGNEKAVDNADDILRNMVDVCSGRIYYRISNWYDIILYLPFSSKIIPVWQEMLGVKTKTVTSHKNKVGFGTHIKVTVNFFRLLFSCPRLMEELDGYFAGICEKFSSIDISSASGEEILEHYQKIKNMTVQKWDITLVNDMYSFIYTGLLKNYLKRKKIPDPDETANKCISGINGLESMRPVKMLAEISERAKKERRIPELEKITSNKEFYEYISENENEFSRSLKNYIELYGDRSVNELKLESRTFRTDPILLIEKIIQYAASDTEFDEMPCDTVNLKGLGNVFAKRAALGIKNRERSRLHRSRLYGMMRAMMLRIGEELAAAGLLDVREDIFYLTFSQTENAVHYKTNMKAEVLSAKEKYRRFEQLPAYSRLVFAEKVFDKDTFSAERNSCGNNGNVFRGTPCSQGTAEGEVIVITDPSETVDTSGKIIAAKMTDPGWVFLIAGAKGIITEKGSLLSHTAIISRELKKPSVVGAENITEILKSGDIVRIDGGSGEIRIVKSKKG